MTAPHRDINHRQFRVFAHRGASGEYPENTLLAFERAIAQGARWLEIDVQLVENRVVVFHDRGLGRRTNGKGLLSRVSFDYLRTLDAGSGERIPTLEETLALVRGRAGLNVEFKGARVTAAALSVLKREVAAEDRESILVSSFTVGALRTSLKHAPEFPRALIFEKIPANLHALAESLGVSSVHFDLGCASRALIEQFHASRRKCYLFTINSVDGAERVLELGGDGLFTDYPGMIISALGKLAQQSAPVSLFNESTS